MLYPEKTKDILTSMSEGNTCIHVQGCAGSGKTIISLFAAAFASLQGNVLFLVPSSEDISLYKNLFSVYFPKLLVGSSLSIREKISIVTAENIFVYKENIEKFDWMIIDNADFIEKKIFSFLSFLSPRFLCTSSFSSLHRPLLNNGIFYSIIDFISAHTFENTDHFYLKKSYRLIQDTVDILSPLLDGGPFSSLASYPSRSLELPSTFYVSSLVDRAISFISSGVSFVTCNLPYRVFSSRIDDDIILVVKEITQKLFSDQFVFISSGEEHIFSLDDILFVTPDVAHNQALRSSLSPLLPNVVTIDKFSPRSYEFPCVIVLDHGFHSSLLSHAFFLYHSFFSSKCAIFYIRRPFENIFSPQSIALKPDVSDRNFEAFRFLSGIDILSKDTSRSVNIEKIH